MAAGYIPARHHQLIVDALEEAAFSDDARIMIFMPPGAAKSTYGSILFAPWYLAQFPGDNVMGCSHTQTLAERFGRRVRNLILSYPDELGITIANDNAAAGRWQLGPWEDHAGDEHEGGEYLAAGVGMGIAGFRSDLTIIDDPIKSKEDADSETVRQKIWDWWEFDVQPRLKPGGRVILIQTRWHEDDLAGRLLASEGEIGKDPNGVWRVIRLPMVAEDENDPLGRRPGERLWPEWFTSEMVDRAKKNARLWSALYQQRPTAAEGSYWKKAWLHPVPAGHVPPLHTLRIYGGSDYATKEGKGDYTVHVVVGLDPDDRPWLLDAWRKQTTSDRWIDAWCKLVKKWRPIQWGEETGQILNSVGPMIEREQRKQKAYTDRVQFTPRVDKAATARSMQAHIATMGLWYSEDLELRPEIEDELLAFPSGKHDDAHDALGKVGLLLDYALHGDEPKAASPSKASGYRNMKAANGGMQSIKVA